jgi:hypothetical protein
MIKSFLDKMNLPENLFLILVDKMMPIGVFLPDFTLDEAYFDFTDFTIKPY